MTARDESRLLQADPTKEFFVFMLTRDIDLDDAVTDLIDNSVDGARRLRAGGHFNGLTVAVTAQQDMFRIADNCGGIEVDIARNYAFRFGRASGTPTTAHSIGQFGVGMKRGLFKIGRNFRIESTSERSRFTVGVNVEEWQTHDRWAFLIDDLEEPDSPFPPERRGTIIEVTNLREDAASQFGLENFQSRLAREIEAKHRRSMLKGLTISLNGVQLKPHNDTILNSDQIQPAYDQGELTYPGPEPVRFEILAGIGTSKPTEAGWNVYCNDRLVLGRDRTEVTGWGDGVPRYHNQFAEFRGYAYLDCDNASLLPWNTTKSGLDTDSGVYRAVRQKMVELMRPVIDFLNELDGETTSAETDKPLTEAVNSTEEVEVSAARKASTFVRPTLRTVRATPPRVRRIAYDKPNEQVEQVQRSLGVDSLRRVGEETFDYYYNLECRDDA